MINRIPQLPTWCLTGTRPAFYDTESNTAIEQTAKLYSTMQTLIEDYNKFANELNTAINTFVEDSNVDQEEFEAHINKIVHDYIIMIDSKIELQDKEIAEAKQYMVDNIVFVSNQLMKEAIEQGKIYIAHEYNSESKKVTIILKEEVE